MFIDFLDQIIFVLFLFSYLFRPWNGTPDNPPFDTRDSSSSSE